MAVALESTFRLVRSTVIISDGRVPEREDLVDYLNASPEDLPGARERAKENWIIIGIVFPLGIVEPGAAMPTIESTRIDPEEARSLPKSAAPTHGEPDDFIDAPKRRSRCNAFGTGPAARCLPTRLTHGLSVSSKAGKKQA